MGCRLPTCTMRALAPTVIRSPVSRIERSSRRRPLTKVPLVEPRSSIPNRPSLSGNTRACWREISTSLASVPSPSAWRPITNSSSTRITRPAAFPSTTLRRSFSCGGSAGGSELISMPEPYSYRAPYTRPVAGADISPGIRVGADLVEIERVARLVEKHESAEERLFTAGEREYCRSKPRRHQHLAARWAAKEAVGKALGTGVGGKVSWQEVEVVIEPGGRPAHPPPWGGREVRGALGREGARGVPVAHARAGHGVRGGHPGSALRCLAQALALPRGQARVRLSRPGVPEGGHGRGPRRERRRARRPVPGDGRRGVRASRSAASAWRARWRS